MSSEFKNGDDQQMIFKRYSLICAIACLLCLGQLAGRVLAEDVGGAEGKAERPPEAKGEEVVRVTAGDDPERVTLEATDADLTDLIRMIAGHANLNLIVDPDVSGRVTVSLRNVLLDDALRLILQSNGCLLQKEHGILRVLRSQQLADAMQTRHYQLNALSINDVQQQLPQFLSSNGKMIIHPQHNSFVVVDRPEVLAAIDEFVAAADARERQVMIEAHLVEVALDKRDEFGFSWTWLDPRITGERITGTVAQTLLPESTNFRVALNNQHFNSIFQALQTHGNTNLLSSPTITTLNNKEAKVEITEDIPYIQSTTTIDTGGTGTSTSTETVEFITVGVKLTVLPEIGQDDCIKMKVTPEVSEAPTRYLGIPVVEKRSADTTLLVRSEQTMVLGGLIRENMADTERRVPILGSIPILGNLFKSKDKTIVKVELLIFITPRIITDELAARQVDEGQQRLDAKRQEFANPPILPKRKGE